MTPLLFIVINMLFVPVATLFRTGGGVVGGAVAVVLVGLGGGFAFSGRGPLWARLTAGVPAVGLVGLIAFGLTTDIGAIPSQEALPSFAGLTFALLMVLWVAACSISHKKVAPSLPRRIYRGHFVDVTHKSTQSEISGKT